MSKKTWERMEQFQAEIDQWRARAELAEKRVAALDAKITQAAKLIRPACQFEGEVWFTTSELIAMARMVWAVLANEALAGRKEG